MTNLDSILKSRDITLPMKVCLVKAMVSPVVMYGCESWTIKKAEHRRTDAFELWFWRRLLRVPGTAKRSNQSILKERQRGQILPEGDLSFCRGQSLLPDHNSMGEATYGGGAEATVSGFLSGSVTSGLVWTSFPHVLSAQAEGVKRRSRGSSASDLAKRTLKEHLSNSSSLYFLSFLESW